MINQKALGCGGEEISGVAAFEITADFFTLLPDFCALLLVVDFIEGVMLVAVLMAYSTEEVIKATLGRVGWPSIRCGSFSL